MKNKLYLKLLETNDKLEGNFNKIHKILITSNIKSLVKYYLNKMRYATLFEALYMSLAIEFNDFYLCNFPLPIDFYEMNNYIVKAFTKNKFNFVNQVIDFYPSCDRYDKIFTLLQCNNNFNELNKIILKNKHCNNMEYLTYLVENKK